LLLQPNKTNDIKKATSNFAMIFLKKEFKLNSSESYHYAKKIQYFLFEKCHLGTNRMQDTRIMM